jgi:hypothetical protein
MKELTYKTSKNKGGGLKSPIMIDFLRLNPLFHSNNSFLGKKNATQESCIKIPPKEDGVLFKSFRTEYGYIIICLFTYVNFICKLIFNQSFHPRFNIHC